MRPVPTAICQDAAQIYPLTLRTRIVWPGVYGWDSKRGILLVSALGNNTVEIVDQQKRVNTITGLEPPQAGLRFHMMALCRADALD
jgi:hypothetical protein